MVWAAFELQSAEALTGHFLLLLQVLLEGLTPAMAGLAGSAASVLLVGLLMGSEADAEDCWYWQREEGQQLEVGALGAVAARMDLCAHSA